MSMVRYVTQVMSWKTRAIPVYAEVRATVLGTTSTNRGKNAMKKKMALGFVRVMRRPVLNERLRTGPRVDSTFDFLKTSLKPRKNQMSTAPTSLKAWNTDGICAKKG